MKAMQRPSLVALALMLCNLDLVSSFTVVPGRFVSCRAAAAAAYKSRSGISFVHAGAIKDDRPPEWAEAGAESDESVQEEIDTDDQEAVATGTAFEAPAKSTHYEFAALLPGQSLPIAIGDVSNARKAWKKRRRSYSPILVPCSLLSIPRYTAVRNNIIYLVNRYGQPMEDGFLGGGRGGGNGVSLTVGNLKVLYRKLLKGDLRQHARDLGHESIDDLLREIMDTNVKMKYGIELVEAGNGERTHTIVLSSLPKNRARHWVHNVALAQVESVRDCDKATDKNGRDVSVMPHTGTVKARRKLDAKEMERNGDGRRVATWLEPMGVALRISTQRQTQAADDDGDDDDSALTSSWLAEGNTKYAHVFQYDAHGDDGAPLLIFSLDPPKMESSHRRQTIQKQRRARETKMALLQEGVLAPEVNMMLADLQVGKGPFTARVVKVSTKAQAVFVDIGVGRKRGKHSGGGMTQVLGMLRFDDLFLRDEHPTESSDVETFQDADDEFWESNDIDNLSEGYDDIDEDEDDDDDDGSAETMEDVSNQFTLGDDGMLYQVDLETGEKIALGSTDDEGFFAPDDDDEDEGEVDQFKGMSASERYAELDRMLAREEAQESSSTSQHTSMVQVGDELPVYIKSVSMQSGRFIVTTDDAVQGMTAKKLKQSSNAEKKLSKLSAMLGGEDGLKQLLKSRGTKCEGTIKATSHAGDWCYIQPDFQLSSVTLPVGVGMFMDDDEDTYAPGDKVRIQLDGIDDHRGQLALKVLGKLSP